MDLMEGMNLKMNHKEITISNICKKHGKKEILKSVTFKARPKKITAFLGVNGAGKSSTLRILLGLDKQQSGVANFGNKRYNEIQQPLKEVGAVFDGLGGAKTRKVYTHLKMIAQSNQIAVSRVDEVLTLVNLMNKKKARLGTLSLGEGQRLGLAQALLGNPQFLVLDEPTNGLDPSGIRWFRDFIRKQASKGKTILFSSHILSDVEEIADDVIIIHQGAIVATLSLDALKENHISLEEMFFKVTEQGGLS